MGGVGAAPPSGRTRTPYAGGAVEPGVEVSVRFVRLEWWTRRIVVFFASFFLVTVG